jgi:serine/threonine protein kinase
MTMREKKSSRPRTQRQFEEDAKLFVDLLRKMFNYDHTKHITASQALEHPLMQEIGQTPCVLRALMTGVQNASLALRTNHPPSTSRTEDHQSPVSRTAEGPDHSSYWSGRQEKDRVLEREEGGTAQVVSEGEGHEPEVAKELGGRGGR